MTLTLEQAHQIAIAHHQAGRLDQALALFRQIVAHQPQHSDAWHRLGLIELGRGRYALAVEALAHAASAAPMQAAIHSDLGVANWMAQRGPEAVASFRRAIELQPGLSHAYSNLADALFGMDRVDEAIACYRHCLALNPNSAVAHNNLGNALMAKNLVEEAAASYERAAALDPGLLQAETNLGDALTKLGRLDEAMERCRRALAIRPDFAGGHLNMGVVFWRRGEHPQAKACYLRALQCDPNLPNAHLNLGLLLLLLGEFEAGWREYEWRFDSTAMTRKPPRFAIPRWDGEPAPGRTILIHVDQGLGDSIHFLRYVPLVRAKAGASRVILACQPELVRLANEIGGWEAEVVAEARVEEADLHVPLLSLPLRLGLSEPLPMSQPYLHAETTRRGAWRARLDAKAKLRVGLAWAGSPLHKDDRWRTIALERLRPVLSVPEVRFYSLQISPRGEADPAITDFTADIADCADSAALIAELDLVITADTAVAHLTGALGRPVWTLVPFVPDWRWGLGREDTPWYPSMRLFRQPVSGDWDAVIARVAAELRALR